MFSESKKLNSGSIEGNIAVLIQLVKLRFALSLGLYRLISKRLQRFTKGFERVTKRSPKVLSLNINRNIFTCIQFTFVLFMGAASVLST